MADFMLLARTMNFDGRRASWVRNGRDQGARLSQPKCFYFIPSSSCLKKNGNFSVWIFRRALIYDRPAFQIRPTDVMNLEAGFRRIALTVSIVGVVFGLVVTGYDTYKTVLHVRSNNEWGQCVKQAEQMGAISRRQNIPR